MNSSFPLLFLALLFAACSSKQGNSTDTIDDSLYKYVELKKTAEMSQEGSSYKKLDSLQKKQFLPDITKGLAMDKDFLYSSLFSAYFVAKQKKIGTLQPIILKLTADDFSASVLINLNERNIPVSFLFIDGQEFCGSDHNFYCEKSTHSILNGTEIITYDLFHTESTNNNEISYTDSIVYKSIIKPDGTIKTNKIDSIRVIIK
jgi:hypothetical protein